MGLSHLVHGYQLGPFIEGNRFVVIFPQAIECRAGHTNGHVLTEAFMEQVGLHGIKRQLEMRMVVVLRILGSPDGTMKASPRISLLHGGEVNVIRCVWQVHGVLASSVGLGDDALLIGAKDLPASTAVVLPKPLSLRCVMARLAILCDLMIPEQAGLSLTTITGQKSSLTFAVPSLTELNSWHAPF